MLRRLCPLLLAVLACAGCATPQKKFFEREAVMRCLPPDVTLDDVVQAYTPTDKFTVEQELIDLGAHVDDDGNLVDEGGKQIRFFRETPCWGAAATECEQLKMREAEQLAKLSEQYTVVTLTANPTGIPSP
jgi:hypothetical protein